MLIAIVGCVRLIVRVLLIYSLSVGFQMRSRFFTYMGLQGLLSSGRRRLNGQTSLVEVPRRGIKLGLLPLLRLCMLMWLQRNANVFSSKLKLDSCNAVVNRVMFNIACRCSDEMKDYLL